MFRVMLYVAALSACAASDETGYVIERTHDACAALALVAEQPTTLQWSGMQAAEALWRDRGVPALGRRAGTTLEVRFEDASAPFHGLYDDHEAIIYINTDLDDEQVLSIVIAHELGHAFGLTHVSADDRPSVMNPGNLATPPTEADQRQIEALWGACQ